jgi:hypothetical protein
VLIYLFRDERSGNRALTMDVTGRNIPPVALSTVWLFVETINTFASTTMGHCRISIRGAPGEDDRLLSLRGHTTSPNASMLMRSISVSRLLSPKA